MNHDEKAGYLDPELPLVCVVLQACAVAEPATCRDASFEMASRPPIIRSVDVIVVSEY
jgi:hypothetical protein